MNPLFRIYLRNQRPLMRYLEWLVAKRNPLAKAWVWVLAKGVLRHILRAKWLTASELEQLLAEDRFGITQCVCAAEAGVQNDCCIFIGEAVKAYQSAGPFPIRNATREEVRMVIAKAKSEGRIPITPTGNVPWFPSNYCICNCDSRYCMPRRFRSKHGLTDAFGRNRTESTRLQLILAHVIIVVLFPFFLVTYLWSQTS